MDAWSAARVAKAHQEDLAHVLLAHRRSELRHHGLELSVLHSPVAILRASEAEEGPESSSAPQQAAKGPDFGDALALTASASSNTYLTAERVLAMIGKRRRMRLNGVTGLPLSASRDLISATILRGG